MLRVDPTDAIMLALLPQVDSYIKNATGRDWTGDSTVHPVAKMAARILLVRSYEDPGGMASGGALGWGLTAALAQLEALATHYYEIEGGSGAGYIALEAAQEGDAVSSVTGLSTGYTGDQSALFETVISETGYIRQLSGSLDGKFFRVLLTPLGEQ